jgi:YaiO family outer membrane protein
MLRAVWITLYCLISALSGYSQDAPSTQSDSLSGHSPDSIKLFLNTLEVGFRFENFEKNYNDRTFFYVQYGRRIKQVDVFGKVLRYTLGSLEGYQFETEAYWKFRRQGYFYFDAAYSDSFILPNYRLRAEVFQSSGRFEYSLGAGVVKPFNFKNIPVLTGTIGYYFGDYFVYARPTFSYVDDGFTKSIFVQGRKYFTKTDFIAFSVLRGADTGTSRDINSVANTFGNDTYLVRFNAQFKAGRYKFGGGADYGGLYIPERTEYAKFVGFDVFINREF